MVNFKSLIRVKGLMFPARNGLKLVEQVFSYMIDYFAREFLWRRG